HALAVDARTLVVAQHAAHRHRVAVHDRAAAQVDRAEHGHGRALDLALDAHRAEHRDDVAVHALAGIDGGIREQPYDAGAVVPAVHPDRPRLDVVAHRDRRAVGVRGCAGHGDPVLVDLD